MEIPKEQILEFLKSQGRGDQVGPADSELPDQVDTEAHGGLLAKFGIDPQELISKLGGLGGLGDLGSKFGL